MTTTLNKLSVGDEAIVESLGDDDAALKLIEMGILIGEQIRVERKAPLGCPVSITIGDSVVSLRMSEAAKIKVTKIK